MNNMNRNLGYKFNSNVYFLAALAAATALAFLAARCFTDSALILANSSFDFFLNKPALIPLFVILL